MSIGAAHGLAILAMIFISTTFSVGDVIADALVPIAVNPGDVLQRGKRRFVRLMLP